MQIFEYPYLIITIFIICFVFIGAIGVYFAIRGLKTASGNLEYDFLNTSKLESEFNRLGKNRSDRCVIYVDVSTENARDNYSEPNVFTDVKQILLQSFGMTDDGGICVYGEKNYLAVTDWDIELARQNIENCMSEVTKCILKYEAINIVNVKMGFLFAVGTNLTFDEAINRAKQAYMIAKNEQTLWAEWDISRAKELEQKIKIENNIEKEIDNNRFFLVYQPVLEAKTKKIIGAEVLSRLNSESDGVLAPGSFLSAVDSVGLNDKFDYYIFEKNCKWISNDKAQREGYKYTINFSRSTLSEPRFAEKIIEIAEKYDLKFSCLAVEILEDKQLTGDARKQMIDNLATLKDKGVSVLIDDFGSGFTSFGDLQNFDVSVVKIDKAITQSATTETGFIILKNIISTAQGIGFKTLCEGIETKEQEDAVIAAGCDLLQGYYYYKPMPVSNLEKLLSEKE